MNYIDYNTYIDMYFNNLNAIRKNPSDAYLFVKSDLSRDEYLKTIKRLCHFDYENGSFSVNAILNLDREDKDILLKNLLLLYNKTNDVSLKSILKRIISATKLAIEETMGYAKDIAPHRDSPLSETQRKVVYFRQYAFNRAMDSKFCPVATPSISTRKFDGATRKELISLFNPQKFYQLTYNDQMSLLQAVANDYLRAQGVKPCAIKLAPLAFNGDKICYGEYDPNMGAIKLNSRLFDNMEDLDNCQNAYYPIQLLSTVIHEATHHVQFQKLGTESFDGSMKDNLVESSLVESQVSKTHAEYLAEADELDARNASLDYIKNAISGNGSNFDLSLAAFYNYMKDYEARNNTLPVSEQTKQCFDHLYLSSKLPLPRELANFMADSKQDMLEAMMYGNLESVR